VAAAAFAVVATLSVELALMGAGFTAALTDVVFVAGAFVAIDSAIATSTIDSSSLAILETRSFTIPIHTTGTIRMGTIPTDITLMVTDTVALAAAAFVVVAFAAVGDPYDQAVYEGLPN
jgi:hypothetical protein